MKYNCLILDDETIAQEIIEEYLKPLDQFNLVAKCKNAFEANNLLSEKEIDLIFLDIEMPGLNGLAYLESLKNPPIIIFTTAHREYALDGFNLNAIDYLLKPISVKRFMQAINKFLASVKRTPKDDGFIYLKVDGKVVRITLNEILYIEGLSNYVKIIRTGKTLISYQKLSYLEEVLPTAYFRRIHKSYIVNLNKVSAYTHSDLELGDHQLPIGAKYKASLIERLNQNLF